MARQYSNEERALIKSIYRARKSNNYVLTNVFDQWLNKKPGICFDLKKGNCIFDGDIYIDVNTILDIKKEIIGRALFVKHLEDNSYIYIIQDDTSTNPPKYVGAQSIKNRVIVAFPKDIVFIIQRSLYNIYVSYPLSLLVENNFKTYEELQLETANKQTKYAMHTLCVAILTLITSLILPHCSRDKENKFQIQKILLQTNNILENSTENILTSIDSLNATGNHFKLQNEDVIQNLKRQERLLKTMNNRIKKIQEQTNNSQMTNTNPE